MFSKIAVVGVGALSVLSNVAPANAGSLPKLSPRNNIAAAIDPVWDYQGCYVEVDRTLVGPSISNQNMTIESCTAFCSALGYVFAGTEYSEQCYCGNTVAPAATLAPPKDCLMPCSGNGTEACGGPDRLSLFWNGQTISTDQGSGNWSLAGCFTEGIGGRTLPHEIVGGPATTVGTCTSACQAAGFVLAGVEYGNECWCGNTFSSGGAPAPNGLQQCNYQCAGNSSEYCGGADFLDVYSFNNAIAGIVSSSVAIPTPAPTASPSGTGNETSTIASPTPTPTGPAIKPTVGSYSYLGCQTEATNSRALTSKVGYSDTMTLETCSNICSGYIYFGVEYGRECYCGNSFSAGSIPANQTDCSFPCPGNINEFCGAGSRLSTYQLNNVTLPTK